MFEGVTNPIPAGHGSDGALRTLWFWTIFLGGAFLLGCLILFAGIRKAVGALCTGPWAPEVTLLYLALGVGGVASGAPADLWLHVEPPEVSSSKASPTFPYPVVGRRPRGSAAAGLNRSASCYAAPFSGLPCVFFTYHVEARRESAQLCGDPDGKRLHRAPPRSPSTYKMRPARCSWCHLMPNCSCRTTGRPGIIGSEPPLSKPSRVCRDWASRWMAGSGRRPYDGAKSSILPEETVYVRRPPKSTGAPQRAPEELGAAVYREQSRPPLHHFRSERKGIAVQVALAGVPPSSAEARPWRYFACS